MMYCDNGLLVFRLAGWIWLHWVFRLLPVGIRSVKAEGGLGWGWDISFYSFSSLRFYTLGLTVNGWMGNRWLPVECCQGSDLTMILGFGVLVVQRCISTWRSDSGGLGGVILGRCARDGGHSAGSVSILCSMDACSFQGSKALIVCSDI
jgi:hypothetical protein